MLRGTSKRLLKQGSESSETDSKSPRSHERSSTLTSNGRLTKFQLRDIKAATKGFSPSSVLGRGILGDVYLGNWGGQDVVIKRCQDVAIKRANFSVIDRVSHPHVVKFFGYCPDKVHPWVVYEYKPGGNLAEGISGSSAKGQGLCWVARLRIAKEVASALAYLNEFDPYFLYLDLKPWTILLDGHRTASVGGWVYGMSVRDGVFGTQGYIAPETMLKRATVKSKTFAFGVLLLQLLTGILHPGGLRSMLAGGNLADASVPSVLQHLDKAAGEWDCKLAENFATLAVQCVSEDPKKRPDMADEVLPKLRSIHADARSEKTCSALLGLLHRARPEQPGTQLQSVVSGQAVQGVDCSKHSQGQEAREDAKEPLTPSTSGPRFLHSSSMSSQSSRDDLRSRQDEQAKRGMMVQMEEGADQGPIKHEEGSNPPQSAANSASPDSLPPCTLGLTRFLYSELDAATEGFSQARVLGRGAFGEVFLGHLRGIDVAVKRMHQGSGVLSGLDAELQVLSRVRHPHIVNLMGFCPEMPHPCVVYEYLPGGDLHDNLRGCLETSGRGKVLGLVDRMRIAKEVASALVYIEGFQPCIAHLDLKPKNIMLDAHGTAKIADWGLAMDINGSVSVQGPVGTRGSMAPEIPFEHRVSPKSDTYSFGIILLQLLTGILSPFELHSKLPPSPGAGLQEATVATVLQYLDKGAGEWDPQLAARLAAVALLCVAKDRTKRPDLGRGVLPELKSIHAAAEEAAQRLQETPSTPILQPPEAHIGAATSVERKSFTREDTERSSSGPLSRKSEDRLAEAVTLLGAMNLSSDELADAADIMYDMKKATIFCVLPEEGKLAWLRKQLANTK